MIFGLNKFKKSEKVENIPTELPNGRREYYMRYRKMSDGLGIVREGNFSSEHLRAFAITLKKYKIIPILIRRRADGKIIYPSVE